MIITKILYLILIIISVLFYILYIGDFSLYLMIFILAFPIVLGITMLIAKFRIKFSISTVSAVAVKKGKCCIKINAENKTIFPFSNSLIKIEYKNKFSDIKNEMTVSVPIHSLTKETLSFYLSSDYCGILEIKIKSVKIYDYIKLFSCSIKPHAETKIYILPDCKISLSCSDERTINSDDSNIFSKHKSGDDPSEVFDLKDYAAGDKISRIHWNLSSRQNKLITRHYSQGINSSVAVAADISSQKGEADVYSIDTVLDALYSVSMFFINGEVPFELYIQCWNADQLKCIEISDIDSLTDSFLYILDNVSSDSEESIFKNAEQIIDGKSKVFFICIGNSLPENIISGLDDTEISAILVNDSLNQSRFSSSELVRISEIPPGKLTENIEKILLM
ncbi:DUF58 domain-containing protein [Porcipelethomonas sp.]|uniref:DUF58 domain-containing protein n=1 Tax=Porcipelethomonas sp. TaxID=2981675 RepID=UPI003EF17BDE